MMLARACLLMICTLAACAGQSADMLAPEPLPAMIEHNKLDYSTNTRSLINKYVDHMRNRLEKDHGPLVMENYQVDSNVAFVDLLAHYESALNSSDELWTPIDDAEFAWSDQSNGAGWRNGEQVFVVLVVRPQKDTDRMPVQTLSNL